MYQIGEFNVYAKEGRLLGLTFLSAESACAWVDRARKNSPENIYKVYKVVCGVATEVIE